jgi:hypothetical protein
VDAWLATVSELPPTEILHEGGPWGYLEQKRLGEPIAPSMPFTSGAQFAAEARPWLELLTNGTFSAATLEQTVPLSWMVSAEWTALVNASAYGGSRGRNGTTWLHELHLGVMAAEAWALVDAKQHFTASMHLKPTAIAARNLAALEKSGPARWNPLAETNATAQKGLYQIAWELAAATPAALGGETLQYHLAGEIGQFLGSAHIDLTAFVASFAAVPGCAKRGKLCDSDQVAFAVLQAAQSGKNCSTVFDLIETWPFTTMVGAMSSFVQMASPASGMWGTCVLAEAMKAANKTSLNHAETVAALKARPPPEWVIYTSG